MGRSLQGRPCSRPTGEAMDIYDQWNDFLKRSRGWSIRMSFELLHSEAYRELTYAPALKVLNWFHEKIRFQVNKGKRGKNRYEVVNDGEIDFTYREAGIRGLTSHQFRNALRELNRIGFIDVKRPGSALKGDWTVFTLSERWKRYGTPSFDEREYPKSVHWVNFGFKTKQRRYRKKLDVEINT